MQHILGLSTTALLLLAGTSSAQQPSVDTSSSSAPVIQSVPPSSYAPATSSPRRFGRLRGGNAYDGGTRFFGRRSANNSAPVVAAPANTAPSQPIIQASATEPSTENKPAVKTEPAGTTTPMAAANANPPIQQPTATSSRRGSRGGLLSRIGARLGR